MDSVLTWAPVVLAGLAVVSVLTGEARSALLFGPGAIAMLAPHAVLEFVSLLPPWLSSVLAAVLLVMAFQGVATILFGRDAANQVTGAVLVRLTALAFSILRFGGMGWLLRLLRRR